MSKKYLIGLVVFGFFFCMMPIGAHADEPTLFNITSDKGVDVVTLKVGETIKFTAAIGPNKTGWTGSEDLDILGANTDTLRCDPTTYTATQAMRKCKATQIIGDAPDSEMAVYVRSDDIIQRSNVILVRVGNGSSAAGKAVSVTLTGKAMTIVGQPDLTIKVAKAVLVSRKVNGFIKNQYKIGVTVKNVGSGDADAPLYFSFSSGTKGGAIVPTNAVLVKAGMIRKVFVYVGLAEKGKKIHFTADPENKVHESNETNNKATRVVGE
jgi:hypothetical protein